MKMTAAVITVSDQGFRGERADTSGPAICAMLRHDGWEVVCQTIVPDEKDQIMAELIRCADELGVSLVLTSGGTGFSPRDVTPDATKAAVEREAPGIPELMRAESIKITPRGCLSRSAAGIRGDADRQLTGQREGGAGKSKRRFACPGAWRRDDSFRRFGGVRWKYEKYAEPDEKFRLIFKRTASLVRIKTGKRFF